MSAYFNKYHSVIFNLYLYLVPALYVGIHDSIIKLIR